MMNAKNSPRILAQRDRYCFWCGGQNGAVHPKIRQSDDGRVDALEPWPKSVACRVTLRPSGLSCLDVSD